MIREWMIQSLESKCFLLFLSSRTCLCKPKFGSGANGNIAGWSTTSIWNSHVSRGIFNLPLSDLHPKHFELKLTHRSVDWLGVSLIDNIRIGGGSFVLPFASRYFWFSSVQFVKARHDKHSIWTSNFPYTCETPHILTSVTLETTVCLNHNTPFI